MKTEVNKTGLFRVCCDSHVQLIIQALAQAGEKKKYNYLNLERRPKMSNIKTEKRSVQFAAAGNSSCPCDEKGSNSEVVSPIQVSKAEDVEFGYTFGY